MVHAYAQKVRADNAGVNPLEKRFAVDEAEAIELATQLKVLCDKGLDYIHTKVRLRNSQNKKLTLHQTLFDIMPSMPVTYTEPYIMPGGVSSEYQMDFLLGTRRPRPLSMLLTMKEILTVKVCLGIVFFPCTTFVRTYYFFSKVLGKVIGPSYRYGSNLAKLFSTHVVEKNPRRVTPFMMLKRIYYRLTKQKLQ